MILQELHRYYQRKTRELNTDLPPIGFEYIQLSYVLVINAQGELLDIIPRIQGKGKNKFIPAELVPQSVKRASGIKANLLWDNIEYLLGFDINSKGKPERTQNCFDAFVGKIADSFPHSKDVGIIAVQNFYQREEYKKVFFHPQWMFMLDSTGDISFQLENDAQLICQRPVVTAFVENKEQQLSASQDFCMVTGKLSNIVPLHAAISGVWGGQSTGTNIVSFNKEAFCSYGKENGFNAPISRSVEYAYTTALNYLLRKGSPQRMQVGDASVIWWSSAKTEFESGFLDLFSDISSPKDEPNAHSDKIDKFLKLCRDSANDEVDFYVLGLAPNAARVSIRFWYEESMNELSDNLRRYFEELSIVHAPYHPDHIPLFKLLLSTALLNKADNISPQLGGEMMTAILHNTPYPHTLLNAVIQRVRAARNVHYYHAALIKAWLIRRHKQEVFTVSLDVECKNVAYRLGRLFATLEKAQIDAVGDINSGIRDRYYGAASSTPVVVFPRLLKLASHHLSKMQYKVKIEKMMGEIMFDIETFPAALSLDEQARFALGYYHQRHVFYIPKAVAA